MTILSNFSPKIRWNLFLLYSHFSEGRVALDHSSYILDFKKDYDTTLKYGDVFDWKVDYSNVK